MRYLKRWLEQKIAESFESHPVVILTGPRQVGKSTLLEHAEYLENWRYLTLDDPDVFEQAKEDPKGLLIEDKPTIIDEVQRCPELLLTVKYYVDQTKRKRNFILSGSGNVALRRSPRETLAGRAKYLHLNGLSFREIHHLDPQGVLDQIWNSKEIKPVDEQLGNHLLKTVWRGGLPGVVLAPNDKIAWDRGVSYIDTYIHRDIQDLVKIRHPQNFRRLMEFLAQATGRESVQDELSKQCSETRSNVSRYMSLLQATGLLYELKGYASRRERVYKQAKYYWFDSGAACFLSGISSHESLNKQNLRGRYFENYILQQINCWASTLAIEPEIYYWKPKQSESEVDFVLRSGVKMVAIEVKSSLRLDFKDTKSMRNFLKNHADANQGIIVYAGDRIFSIASNIMAVPWYCI